MLITSVARQERPEEWIYNEKKLAKQFMITETASQLIDKIAQELGISRSEVIERAARCGGIGKAKNFDPKTGKCRNKS